MSRRLTALVIGNADYAAAERLKDPGTMRRTSPLTECGFTLATDLNCSHKEMDQSLKDFKTRGR